MPEPTLPPHAPGSPLGFGCAGLLRLPSAADQTALLECAYDEGVRHFDVARMYGLGKAEEVVGRFAAARRDDVTLTTKFGIQVSGGLSKVSNVQSVARWVLQRFPGLRKRLRGKLGGSTTRDFSVTAARASVEESLRMLGVETIDFLMLHEPQTTEGIGAELVDYLEGLRANGSVRAYGTAAELGVLEALAGTHPSLTALVQAPAPNRSERRGEFLQAPGRRLFTFGHLQADLEGARIRLDGRADEVRALGLDPADPDAPGLLLLRQAALGNPHGSTLFFTTSRERLRKTARYVLAPAAPGELAALDAVLESPA